MTDPSKMITNGQSSYETCPECGVRIVDDPAQQNHFPHPSTTANPIAVLRLQVAEEIAAALEAEALSDYDAADDLRWAAAKAREIGAKS